MPAGSRWHQNQPQILWGDETVELGWYIAVLATEYKLLFDANKNTEKTLTELYYAISSFIKKNKTNV